MQIQFAHPLYLLLLIPVLLHILWMARRLQLLSAARRRLAVGLRMIIVLLLVASLAGVRFARRSDDLTVFFLLDRSQSIPNAQRDFGLEFVRKAMTEMGPKDHAGVIVFGDSAWVEQSPSQLRPEMDQIRSVIDPSRTNIADALQLAMACFVGQSQKRIVLLSDGNQNVSQAADVGRSAAAAHIAIDALPLRYENRNDVILERAVVEQRVNLEEPFDLRVIAISREATRARLLIHQDGQLIGEENVELVPGEKNVFVVPTQVRDPGFHTFDVQIDVEGDQIPENNRAYAFTYGKGEPRLLLVDGDIPPDPLLPAMLIRERIRVDVIPPEEMPTTLRDLQAYDEVIFNNVPASSITGDQMRLVERAVHDLGIGFMMVGGESSFGAGGYNDSPIEEALPVEMELKNEKILPKGALVPIVHTVEIPQGQYWAEQILQAALDVLSPADMMGVLYYGWQGGEQWLFPLQEVRGKDHLRAFLNTAQWGDMPSFDLTLQMAHDALVACNASVKHIIVISDGDPQTPNSTLASNIRAAKISISTICINPHSTRDVDVMRELARLGGGNFYHVTSYNTLPQIFIKEAATVRKSLIIEEPFVPVEKQYSPILSGFSKDYPQLLGYVATSTKPLADIPLVTDKGDPLLAHWRHGLGRATAFTSDAKPRWAARWTDWEKFAKFWSQAVRWTQRASMNPNFQVQMDVDGTEGRIIVDAVDPGGQFINFLRINGSVIAPSLERLPVEFRQTAPGRYEANFEAREAGSYMLGAAAAETGADLPEGEGGGELITAGTTLSYSPEFQQSRSNEPLLYRLAEMTGGRVLDIDSPVFLHDRPSWAEPRPLWPVLLTTILFLFLADVFTRRVLVDWRDVRLGMAAAGGWIAGHVQRRRPTAPQPTDQLLDVKKRVRVGKQAPAAQREDFMAALREAKASPGEATAAPSVAGLDRAERKPPAAETSQPSGAPASQPAEQPVFTQDLLKARRRASDRLRKKDGE